MYLRITYALLLMTTALMQKTLAEPKAEEKFSSLKEEVELLPMAVQAVTSGVQACAESCQAILNDKIQQCEDRHDGIDVNPLVPGFNLCLRQASIEGCRCIAGCRGQTSSHCGKDTSHPNSPWGPREWSPWLSSIKDSELR